MTLPHNKYLQHLGYPGYSDATLLRGAVVMALIIRLLACVVFGAVITTAPALAERRVALVIGNSAYKYAGVLTNPVNDATDMAAALKKVGFQVIEGMDLNKSSFDRKIRDFATSVSGADTGLFFYAGHGLQVAGQNYLVPIDAELNTPDALEFEMVRLDVVQRIMERATQTNILFLDACRNNPLARNLARALGTRSAEIGRGLAAVESGSGTLISFSTQPGNVALDGVGRNSPFAHALVRQISTSGEDLSAMLIAVRNDVMSATQRRQVPWEHSALTGRFYFGQAAAGQTPPWRVGEAAEVWNATKETTDIDLLESFIARYKDTFFADLAKSRINELKKRASSELPISSERSGAAPVTECDRLAAADYDEVARAKPIYFQDMRGSDALSACQEAVRLYQNEPRFLFQLGRPIQRTGNPHDAAELHQKAAGAGYIAANLSLARLYELGDGVAKDLAKAREHVDRAADAGNVNALIELARYYRDGVGVPRDTSRTIQYLKKAVDRGSPVAMNDLGWHYRDGIGLESNEREALLWFQRAANLGNLWAMRNIGALY